MRWQSDMHSDQIVCVRERLTSREWYSTISAAEWFQPSPLGPGEKKKISAEKEINIYNEQRSARTCEWHLVIVSWWLNSSECHYCCLHTHTSMKECADVHACKLPRALRYTEGDGEEVDGFPCWRDGGQHWKAIFRRLINYGCFHSHSCVDCDRSVIQSSKFAEPDGRSVAGQSTRERQPWQVADHRCPRPLWCIAPRQQCGVTSGLAWDFLFSLSPLPAAT